MSDRNDKNGSVLSDISARFNRATGGVNLSDGALMTANVGSAINESAGRGVRRGLLVASGILGMCVVGIAEATPVSGHETVLAAHVLTAPALPVPGAEGSPAGTTFEGCAEIGVFIECGFTLITEEGTLFLIEGAGEFEVGDMVFATGTINKDCEQGIPKFCAGIPCLEDVTLAPCKPSNVFKACGQLVSTPFCGTVLAADTGGTWLLNDLGGFKVGDRVFVEGALIDPCFTIPECTASGCVDVSTIDTCGTTYFSGCGQMILSFSCGFAFAADDGSGIYVLDEVGTSQLGDHVFVEGFIELDCAEGSGFCACIRNDAIEPCIPIGDLNMDGIVDGADLGLLLTAWGNCPIFTVGCLGDLNFDGVVDGGDLGIQLSNWTPTR